MPLPKRPYRDERKRLANVKAAKARKERRAKKVAENRAKAVPVSKVEPPQMELDFGETSDAGV
jgi:hypothetical protein